MELRTQDFDYDLPQDLIAQEPAPQRDGSRLMVLHRESGALTHDEFRHIGKYLRAGDVAVANRSRVIPARLTARKESGGTVELLLLRCVEEHTWTALARPSRRLRPGARLCLERQPLTAILCRELGEGQWEVRFEGDGDIDLKLTQAGEIPLPPYIKQVSSLDRYQTVYADRDGSVAAPTAGLHFSDDLLRRLAAGGVRMEYVTLHVGLGTFRPVTVQRIVDHAMHSEWGEVSDEVAKAVEQGRAEGGRVVAIGTTTTRLLESATTGGVLHEFWGETDSFIYPGYQFQMVDALVTNFHLPRSTLLMLVSAFAGRDFVLHAYEEAVRRRYRFFSFGDAMLIL